MGRNRDSWQVCDCTVQSAKYWCFYSTCILNLQIWDIRNSHSTDMNNANFCDTHVSYSHTQGVITYGKVDLSHIFEDESQNFLLENLMWYLHMVFYCRNVHVTFCGDTRLWNIERGFDLAVVVHWTSYQSLTGSVTLQSVNTLHPINQWTKLSQVYDNLFLRIPVIEFITRAVRNV